MQLNPYLTFNGQCETAFRFYESCLRGKIEVMSRFAGTPAEKYMPAGWGDKILHTMLVFDGGVLMGSDDNHHQTPQGMSVCLQVDEPAEAERIFGALVESGSVRMPLAKTFWAERFGMLTDRFGVPWIVNCAGAAQQAAA